MTIDPSGFCSIEDFKARAGSIIRYIKSSAKRPRLKEIFYPETGDLSRKRNAIFLDDTFWDNIIKTANERNIDVKKHIRHAEKYSRAVRGKRQTENPLWIV